MREPALPRDVARRRCRQRTPLHLMPFGQPHLPTSDGLGPHNKHSRTLVKSNNTAACSNQYCHGASLGGVAGSGPSCTSCHLGGPASAHPAEWIPVYSTHGPWAKSNDTAACANRSCHGASLDGVADSVPACTSCHLGGPAKVHPADWIPPVSMHGPYVKLNTTSACANQYCHGLSLTGVANSGPSCTACHL